MTAQPDDSIGWKRAAGLAAVWVTVPTLLLCGAIVLVDVWGSRDRTNPVPFWCHIGLSPVVVLSFLSASSLSGRIHRSPRVEKLVGVASIPGALLTVLCWLSPFLGIIRFGP